MFVFRRPKPVFSTEGIFNYQEHWFAYATRLGKLTKRRSVFVTDLSLLTASKFSHLYASHLANC